MLAYATDNPMMTCTASTTAKRLFRLHQSSLLHETLLDREQVDDPGALGRCPLT
jgi:hypothetical protein